MPVKALEGMTFGCDPEFFVLDQDGEPVAPEDFLPGTKEEPYKVNKGAVQVDGMAAEFNIDPVSTYDDFYTNITTVIHELKKFLPKGYTLSKSPVAVFSEKVWEEASPNAKVLGCSPDWNAWEDCPNPPPNTDQFERTRFAGGHLHLGWAENGDPNDPSFYKACTDLVKQMDWYLGAWSVKEDKDKLRRAMYGKAGAMRFKPYGVEYRTLSNFWLRSPLTIRRTWDRMNLGVHKMLDGPLASTERGFEFSSRLIESINNGKTDKTLSSQFYFPIVEY